MKYATKNTVTTTAMSGSDPARPVIASAAAANGVATSRNGRRPPIGVRSRSDQLPTTSGSHNASTPSIAMSAPITTEESRKLLATTGTYVVTTVIASASAAVGRPNSASVRFSLASRARTLMHLRGYAAGQSVRAHG